MLQLLQMGLSCGKIESDFSLATDFSQNFLQAHPYIWRSTDYRRKGIGLFFIKGEVLFSGALKLRQCVGDLIV